MFFFLAYFTLYNRLQFHPSHQNWFKWILFFGIGMKSDLFQSCGHCWVFQICWHTECSTFTASSSRIWNSSTGIPSPPLALFIVMFSRPTWLHILAYLAVGEWSRHRGYLGREDLFLLSGAPLLFHFITVCSFCVPQKVKVLVTQSSLTLCNPMDCSPLGPSVHGISQAGILEWAAISFSSRSFPPRDGTHLSDIACIGR